jgi:hypothetical protein
MELKWVPIVVKEAEHAEYDCYIHLRVGHVGQYCRLIIIHTSQALWDLELLNSWILSTS